MWQCCCCSKPPGTATSCSTDATAAALNIADHLTHLAAAAFIQDCETWVRGSAAAALSHLAMHSYSTMQTRIGQEPGAISALVQLLQDRWVPYRYLLLNILCLLLLVVSAPVVAYVSTGASAARHMGMSICQSLDLFCCLLLLSA